MSSMFHNNGVVINFRGELVSKFDDPHPPNDDESGVSGLNCTLHFVKPLVMATLFLVFGSCALFVVNLNPNLTLSHAQTLTTQSQP